MAVVHPKHLTAEARALLFALQSVDELPLEKGDRTSIDLAETLIEAGYPIDLYFERNGPIRLALLEGKQSDYFLVEHDQDEFDIDVNRPYWDHRH